MYENGQGISKNYDQALSWYRKAANQGHSGSKNDLKALEYKIKEEQLAIKLALFEANLEKELEREAAVEAKKKEEAEAKKKEEAEAKKKAEAEAKKKLEEDFINALDAYQTKDYKLAIFLYKKAANQGHIDAQFNLALMYDKGEGVTQNHEQATYWYGNAAVQGNAEAQYALAYNYQVGEGINKDYKQAIYWYRKAADQGYDYAENNLGYMYFMGYGVAKDYSQAEYWYRKAAIQGNIYGQSNLGEVYDIGGEGLIQNYKEALYWYKKAANQGDSDAQNNLGKMYENAKGVTQDYKKALSWYKKAVNQNNEKAKQNLESLEFRIESKTNFDYIESYVAESKKKVEVAYTKKKEEIDKAKKKSEEDKLYLQKLSKNSLKLKHGNEKLTQEIRQLEIDLLQKNNLLNISKTAWKTKSDLVMDELNDLKQISLSKNILISNLRNKNEELEKSLSSTLNTNQQLTQDSEKLNAKISEQYNANELLIENHLNTLKSTYIDTILASIRRQWDYRADEDGWRCDIRLKQDEYGFVEDIDIDNCIVNQNHKKPFFIKSIQKAILNASPLPAAPDKNIFESEIIFQFKVN